MEDQSGEGEQECWFGERGYHESGEMVVMMMMIMKLYLNTVHL